MTERVVVKECHEYNPKKIKPLLVQALKDLDFKIPVKKTVLIKPNLLMDKNPNQHITTHPDVVEAACMILKDKGCKILIGESVVFGKKDFLFERCGMTEVAKKYGAKLVAFEGQELIECHGDFLKKLFIPKLLKDVDLIISIPKLKTHMFTEYTGAVKNLFGCIPGSKKSEYHVIGHNQRRFAKILYDIWKNVKPGLTIMDGIVGMEGNGPSAGTPKHTGLLFIAENAYAMDIVGLQTIGFYPKENAVLKIGLQKGATSTQVEILGTIKEIKYKPAGMANIIREKMPKFLMKIAYDMIKLKPYFSKRCVQCGVCKEHCPPKAISEEYKINRKKCIMCYCCHELCPHKAMDVRRGFIGTMALKTYKFFFGGRKNENNH